MSGCAPDRCPVAYNGAEAELAQRIHAHYGVAAEYDLWLKLGIDFWYVPHGEYRVQTAAPAVETPLAPAGSVAEIEGFFQAREEALDVERMFAEQGNAHTDRFRFVSGGGLFDPAWHLRGFQQLLEDFYVEPVLAEALLNSLFEKAMRQTSSILGRFNGAPGERGIDMVFFADDLGTQQDLIFSPEIFRRFLKPRYARLFVLTRAHGAAPALHSCGSVYGLIPDLVDAGLQILNPVQTSARQMDPVRLKREFGRHLTFWGGVDTQTVFAHGTPDDVRRGVRELKRTLGENGGYICAPTHTITRDAPLENVLAFFEEAFA